MYKELLIGCGHRRTKFIHKYGKYNQFQNLVTLDNNYACKPDVLHDLNKLPYPFIDETFDEIHAYEVLEHCGRLGDVKYFFKQFKEFYRILKPKGLLYGSTPSPTSVWVFGDPGHTRVISLQSLMFLNKNQYSDYAKENTPQSDYRYLMGNMTFNIIEHGLDKDTFWFILRRD